MGRRRTRALGGAETGRQVTSDDVITELSRLGLPPGHYVVVGGAALAVRGIRETDDIDLVVTTELFELLSHAEILRRFAFVDLETLAGFKSSYGREKDLQDLDLIAAHRAGGPGAA